MNPNRWYVRSLRRFHDFEIILYGYLGVGGLMSLIYFGGAIFHARLYAYVFAIHSVEQAELLGRIAVQIIGQSIGRCVFWLPQLFWQSILGPEGFWDWLTATNILKTLS